MFRRKQFSNSQQIYSQTLIFMRADKFVPYTISLCVSSVMVMMQMHGENQLKTWTMRNNLYCNLESKNLFNHLRHHCTDSRQTNSA